MQKHTGQILVSPRITEKGAYLSEQGCYVFNVEKSATKKDIAEAVRTIFKVTPRKVTVLRVVGKRVQTRGKAQNRLGKTALGKKAYVYLKKGETIELM